MYYRISLNMLSQYSEVFLKSIFILEKKTNFKNYEMIHTYFETASAVIEAGSALSLRS